MPVMDNQDGKWGIKGPVQLIVFEEPEPPIEP
jgi:hypothetical protein